MKVKCAFIMLFILVVAEIFANKCRLENLFDCGKIRGRFTQEYGKAFPSNEKEMKRQCELFEEMGNCVYNFSHTCMTAMDRIIGEFILTGAAQKMKDICNPEIELFNDYLKEAKCINDNYGPAKSCFRDNLASMILMYQKLEKGMIPYCCGLNHLRKCINDHYENKCGKKAASQMEYQIEMIFSDWLIEMCNPFLEIANDCPPIPELTDQDKYKNFSVISYMSPFSLL